MPAASLAASPPVLVFGENLLWRDLFCHGVKEVRGLSSCMGSDEAQDAVEWARKRKNPIVLIDILCCRSDPFATAERLRRAQKSMRLFFAAPWAAPAWVAAAARLHAEGFFCRCSTLEEVRRALVKPGSHFSSCATRVLMELSQNGAMVSDDVDAEVLRFLSQGWSSKEIGAKLGLSRKTIEARRAKMMLRSGARSGAALVHLGFELGYVLPNPPGGCAPSE